MHVAFSELPEHSRIWIYQANRKLSDQEIAQIEPKIEAFLTHWTAHGSALAAGFTIKYNRFIIIGLNQDQASASGCSIDASVHFIQEIQKELDVDLMDKLNVTFYNGPYIAHKPLADFKKMAKNRSVSKETIVFNNLVNTKEEFDHHWEVPAKESWHARFLA